METTRSVRAGSVETRERCQVPATEPAFWREFVIKVRHAAEFGCRARVDLLACAIASFVAATLSTAPMSLRHISGGLPTGAVEEIAAFAIGGTIVPPFKCGQGRVGDTGDMHQSGGYGHKPDAVSFGCAQQLVISRVWITAAKADQCAFGHINVAADR
jgi:hypothetical protein